ncbi:hypothetical protein [Nocardia beijingensis]
MTSNPRQHRTFVQADGKLAEFMCQVSLMELTVERAPRTSAHPPIPSPGRVHRAVGGGVSAAHGRSRLLSGMSATLVVILWPVSVFFTAVLGFRIRRWWQTIQTDNRHTMTFIRRNYDAGSPTDASDDRNGDDGAWLASPLPDGWVEDAAGQSYSVGPRSEMDAATTPIERVSAKRKAGRWEREDQDTELLPRLQDIRPPMRATPIRRPPWLGKHRSQERRVE